MKSFYLKELEKYWTCLSRANEDLLALARDLDGLLNQIQKDLPNTDNYHKNIENLQDWDINLQMCLNVLRELEWSIITKRQALEEEIAEQEIEDEQKQENSRIIEDENK